MRERHSNVLMLALMLFVGTVLLAAFSTPVIAGVTYSGCLSSATGGISGSGSWANAGITSIAWQISQSASNDPWHYIYAFNMTQGSIDSFVLETSPGFTQQDILSVGGNFSNITVGSFSTAGGEIYGIRFNNVSNSSPTFVFDTYRSPVWGDFLGSNITDGSTAYNTGLSDQNLTSPPTNGNLDSHILVPDTGGESPIPDASTLVLASIGAMPFLINRFIKKRT